MKLYQRKANDPAPLGQADPYMIKSGDGRYYLYASGGEGPQLYSSDHLKEGWKYEGRCLDMTGQKECWAPSVIELDGKYYMYYSCLDADCEDEHGQTLRVAVSDSPSGMFKQVKKLLPPFSIDAHAVKTPSGLYLFYCNISVPYFLSQDVFYSASAFFFFFPGFFSEIFPIRATGRMSSIVSA